MSVQNGQLTETFADGSIQKISLEGRVTTLAANSVVDVEKVFPESEGMRGIKTDGKYGFIDAKGRLLVANRYEAIGQFKEGLAAIKILGKWGFVNISDQIVINPSYEQVSEFKSGIAIIKRNGKLGLIDPNGKIALTLRYDQIEREDDKFILTSNKLKGLADAKGNVLIEPRFEWLDVLENDQVIVANEKRYGVISTKGLSVIPLIYDQVLYVKERNEYMALMKSEWKRLN